MILRAILASLCCVALCSCAGTRGAEGGAPAGYRMVWHDEFDAAGRPDAAGWTYETGFVRNEELQLYRPENAVVKDGMLVIEARREKVANPGYRPDGRGWRQQRPFADYTSASVTTKGLHSWLYGRFEMRARIDTRAGLWPAFWTLGASGRWPAGGEIDIMEYYRGMLLANAAWLGADGRPEWDDTRKPITDFGPEWSSKFHIWRMDWDDKSIRLYVDGRLLNDVDVTKTINQDVAHDNPFHHPQYIIINLAVGGGSGGDPSGTEFPARYEIDWVRVYQKAR